MPDPDELLSPRQVAAVFGVTVKTVGRWETDKRLTVVRTLGGHRRFRRAEVEALRAELAETIEAVS